MRTLFGAGESRVNPFENPSTPLTSAGLLDFFGGSPTDAGISVSEENSLSFTAVWRAVSLLAGIVGGLPLLAYERTSKDELTVRALSEPNSVGMTPFELWETVMTHLLLWGNAYVHKVRNGLGRVVELRPIHPSRVKPRILGPDDDVPGVNKVFEVTGANGSVEPRTSYEIMHIPGLSYDGILGLSPIGLARQTVAIGKAADKMAAKLYGNGAMLSGVLQTDRPLKQDQADALKARWREKMAGLDHGHDVAVLDNATKFVPLTMPPEEAQFLQSRRWQTIEIARWYGIPPHLLGDVEKSTSWGTGIEQQNIGFVAYTVRAWLTRIEQRVTAEVLPGNTQVAKFLVDELLRGDTLARYQAYFQGIQAGWLTRNEARKKENLNPIDGLDVPLQPLLPGSKSIDQDAPVPGAGTPAADEPENDTDPDDPTAGQ